MRHLCSKLLRKNTNTRSSLNNLQVYFIRFLTSSRYSIKQAHKLQINLSLSSGFTWIALAAQSRLANHFFPILKRDNALLFLHRFLQLKDGSTLLWWCWCMFVQLFIMGYVSNFRSRCLLIVSLFHQPDFMYFQPFHMINTLAGPVHCF